jgi:hypothetical protein
MSAAAPPANRLPLLLLAIACVIAVAYAPPSSRFVGFDTSVYGAVAFSVAHGSALYQDVWDHKNPLHFYLAAATQMLFPGSVSALNALALLAVLSITLLLYAFVARWAGPLAGGLAALLFACATPTLRPSFSPDLYIGLLALVAFGLTVRGARCRRARWLFLSGLVCGAAVGFKTSALLDCAAMACVGVYLSAAGKPRPAARHWAAVVAAWVAGLVALPGALAWHFWQVGAWQPFWDAVYVYNGLYVQAQTLTPRFIWDLLYQHLTLQLVNAACLTVPGLVTAVTVWHRPRSDADEAVVIARAAAIWAAFGVLAALIGRRIGYLQYFWELFVPLAVLAGIGLARLFEGRTAFNGNPIRRVIPALLAASALLSLAPTARWSATEWRDLLLNRPRTSVEREIGEYVAARTKPQDRVFVWGMAPGVYFWSQRLPAARYVHCMPLVSQYAGARNVSDPYISLEEFGAALERNRPAYIIMPTDWEVGTQDAPVAPLAHLVAERYIIDTKIGPYHLYRLREQAT